MKLHKEGNAVERKIQTISIAKANVFALFLLVPLLVFMVLPYYLVWGDNIIWELKFETLIFLVTFFIGGIIIHEALHGIFWALFSSRGFKSIRFGVKWEYLAPYCHCSEPLRIWQYIIGALAPLLFMGILPSIWAFTQGNTFIMFFGFFYIWTAAGDILAVWMLRKYKLSNIIKDHPSELGFIVEIGLTTNDSEG